MTANPPIGEIRGRVINIPSQHGMVGPPGHAAYAASKGGVVNLTRQIAVDYERYGVLVNAVAPGKIVTGSPEQQDPETLAYARARTPFHRLGRPDDVAGVVGREEERRAGDVVRAAEADRKSTRLNSSHDQISYAVFCLKKKNPCGKCPSLQ